jgi:hypothetical protein
MYVAQLRSFEQYIKAFASDMLHEADREIAPLNEMAIEPDQFHRQVWLRLRKRTIKGKDIKSGKRTRTQLSREYCEGCP